MVLPLVFQRLAYFINQGGFLGSYRQSLDISLSKEAASVLAVLSNKIECTAIFILAIHSNRSPRCFYGGWRHQLLLAAIIF